MADRKGLKLGQHKVIDTFSWKTKYLPIRTWLERHLRINTQVLKNSLSVTRSNS